MPVLDTRQSLLLVAVICLANTLLRFLPSMVFNGKRKTPRILNVLGKVLPHAIMGMLVVYCLKNVTLTSAPFGAPEWIACAVTAALHLWKRNTMLSVGVGVVAYMLLVQLVF